MCLYLLPREKRDNADIRRGVLASAPSIRRETLTPLIDRLGGADPIECVTWSIASSSAARDNTYLNQAIISVPVDGEM